ncbi:hypothetical protein BKA62DRAFT_725497 [Auriculariales sp. MPI-PUGE-AT-0066]|nr:hypothetical protein BKA62DRAFT_725497 [Auriculariales sp. MPI-PUGE-AT-0066]
MAEKRLCATAETFVFMLGPLPIVVDDTFDDFSYYSANRTVFDHDPAKGFLDNTMTLGLAKGEAISRGFQGLEFEHWASTDPNLESSVIELGGARQGEVSGQAIDYPPPIQVFKESSLDLLVRYGISVSVSSTTASNVRDLNRFAEKMAIWEKNRPKAQASSSKPPLQKGLFPSPSPEVRLLVSGSATVFITFVLVLLCGCNLWPPRSHAQPKVALSSDKPGLEKTSTHTHEPIRSILSIGRRLFALSVQCIAWLSAIHWGHHQAVAQPNPASQTPDDTAQINCCPMCGQIVPPQDSVFIRLARLASQRRVQASGSPTNLLSADGGDAASNAKKPKICSMPSYKLAAAERSEHELSAGLPISDDTTETSSSAKELLIITCMEAALDTQKVFGRFEGDVKVIRNVGGGAKKALPHILTWQGIFKTGEIAVVHHNECSIVGFNGTDPVFRAKPDHTKQTDLPEDFIEHSLERDVAFLRELPVLKEMVVTGWILDTSGEVKFKL